MNDYEYLRASDGTGDAVLAHITAPRAIAATTIEVDSVDGWPDKFIATTGTLGVDGFLDPDTITEFTGHLSGSDIEIDDFEPGHTDVGNTDDEIVIIKPSTGFPNGIVDMAQVSHENNGTLKANTVHTQAIQDNAVTSQKLDATIACRAYRSAALSINNGANRKITLDAENFDEGNNFNTTTGTFTAPVAGKYHVDAAVQLNNIDAAGDNIVVMIYVNGAVYAQARLQVGAAGGEGGPSVSTLVSLAASGTIELYALHDSATTSEVVSNSSEATFMSIYRVGA